MADEAYRQTVVPPGALAYWNKELGYYVAGSSYNDDKDDYEDLPERGPFKTLVSAKRAIPRYFRDFPQAEGCEVAHETEDENGVRVTNYVYSQSNVQT